jgi:hypothetical protein
VAPEIYGSGVTITKNIGLLRNTGVELIVGGQVVRSGLVTWDTRFSLSQRRDLLVKLGQGVQPFYVSGSVTVNPIGGLRIAPGYPLFGRWTRPILGYADANGNGALEPAEVQLGDTAVYVGATVPDYTAALSTTLSLGHGALTFDAELAHDAGVAQFNRPAQTLSRFTAGRQVPGTPLADQVRTIDLTTNFFSDYNWIETVATTRFSSLAVNYTVPMAWARRVGAQSLRIAVKGGNLGLWTNYRGIDPNVNAHGVGNKVNDTGVVPLPRTWQLQVNAVY